MDNQKLMATTVDLTEGCNLACDYCFTHSDHNVKKMSWDMLKKIIHWWFPRSDHDAYRQFQFWGGEPLLEWKTIQKTVKYIQDLPEEIRGNSTVEFGGTTNGVLYTRDRVEWCLANQSLFLVSLDGIEEVHDARRKMKGGGGSWKIIDKNVREALKVTPMQRVRSSISADYVDRLYEGVLYVAEDLGCRHMAFSAVFEDDWTEEKLEILAEQFELITDFLIKREKEGNSFNVKHLYDEANRSGHITPQNPCGAGNKYSCWSYDGFLYPCHRFNKHGVSTEVRASDKLHIAEPDGEGFKWVNKEWRQEFVDFYKNQPEKCGSCSIAGTSGCHGGCYATSFDLTGSIYIPSKSQCDYQRVQRAAGISFRKKAEAAGVQLVPDRLNGTGTSKKSCTCYNMCYEEGTSNEITHIDRSDDVACICYNTNYTGDPAPQTRLVKEIDAERAANNRVVEAAIKVMGEYNNEEGTDSDESNSGNEQFCRAGDGEQSDDLQHAGSNQCSSCRANKTCGEGKEIEEEDDGAK